MSSERKNEANRQNAQHSTGPKTEEGRQKSSQNARRHGLFSATIFIPEERNVEFKEMFATYYNEIKPIGEIQTAYFEQLVHAVWNLNIARQLLVVALHNMDDQKISSANRYIAQYERSFAKAHNALKDEQTDMALRAIPENEAIADLPIACQIKVIASEASKIAATQERTQRPAYRKALLNAVGQAFRPTPSATPDENEVERAA